MLFSFHDFFSREIATLNYYYFEKFVKSEITIIMKNIFKKYVKSQWPRKFKKFQAKKLVKQRNNQFYGIYFFRQKFREIDLGPVHVKVNKQK